MSRIEDVLYADSLTQNPSLDESKKRLSLSSEMLPVPDPVKLPNLEEERETLNATELPITVTLSDFMGWHFDQEAEPKRKDSASLEEIFSSKLMIDIETTKKGSYIEKLESLGGLASPTARH